MFETKNFKLICRAQACHMSAEERAKSISVARATLDKNGFHDRAILAGTGGQSARETIQLCKEAKQVSSFACALYRC